MSNYLNQLVAKNLNLIDTVQPLLLSVFGFLPESPVEMGNGETWGINQENFMGGGDSPMTTHLETSPEAQILTNSDIVQPLEWRYAKPTASDLSLATDVQTSNNDTSYLLSTGLTPTPTQDSEQTSTTASFLADKSDSKLSSTQLFPQPAEILPTTDKIPPTPNTQLFSSDSAESASGWFTQKEPEAISNHRIPQIQPLTESSRQQPVEINQVFPSPSEPKVVREQLNNAQLKEVVGLDKQGISAYPRSIGEQLSSPQSQLQPAASSPIMRKVPNVLDTQPLQPALAVEQPTTALNKIGMKSEPPNRQEIDFQGERENQIIPETSNAPTISTTESKRQQPVEIHPAVFLPQSPVVVSSERLPTLAKSKPVAREHTTDKVLPTLERQPLTSAQVVEISTPLSELAVKSQQQSVPLLSRQQAIESNRFVPSSPSSKMLREELSSHQSPSQSGAIASAKSEVLGAIETQPLMPAQVVETKSEPTVNSQQQSVPFLSRQPAVESNRFVPSSPSSKMLREELSSHQSPSQSGAIASAKSEVLGAIETQPLMPALTVETNTREALPAVKQLTQPATESKEPQSVRIHPAVSRTQSQEMVSYPQTLTQPQSESVVVETTSERVTTQGIVSVQPTSYFQDRPPLPTPNIIQPINDDTRHSSVFVSASRQEQRQRESFGNSVTPPTIKVSIGSMEIRTPSPLPPPPRPKPRPKPNVMSLDEYLRQRSRGR